MFVAVACSLFVLYTPSFWLATGSSLLASAVVLAAAWGQFRTVDGNTVESILPKLANRSMELTALLLAVGAIVGLAFAGYWLIRPSYPFSRYEIASDGRLLRHIFEAGTEKVAELDGSPVKEPHGIVSAETILTRGRPSWIRPHYRNPWTFLICTRREGTGAGRPD